MCIIFFFSRKKCQCVTKLSKPLIANVLYGDTSQKSVTKCHRSVTLRWNGGLPTARNEKRSPKSLDSEDLMK